MAPASGILSGVNLDWEHETLDQFSAGPGYRAIQHTGGGVPQR